MVTLPTVTQKSISLHQPNGLERHSVYLTHSPKEKRVQQPVLRFGIILDVESNTKFWSRQANWRAGQFMAIFLVVPVLQELEDIPAS